MAVDDDGDARTLSLLRRSLALPTAPFSANANAVHLVLASYLSRQASSILQRAEDELQAPDQASNELRLAALAVFQKLAALPSAVPIDINSLHDFLVVYTTTSEDKEARLAKKVVNDLLRRRPSLVRSLETQVLPSYIAVMRDMASLEEQNNEIVLKKARALSRSMQAILLAADLEQVATVLSQGGGEETVATQFWTALQILYDETLSTAVAPILPAPGPQLAGHAQVQTYVYVKRTVLEVLQLHSPKLHAGILLALLEGEAAGEDVPDSLAAFPPTSCFNLSMLADAETVFSLSSSIGGRSDIGSEERLYLVKGIMGTLAGYGEIKDGLQLVGRRITANGLSRTDKGKTRGPAEPQHAAGSVSKSSTSHSIM